MIKSPFIWEDTDSKQESCREMIITLLPVRQKILQNNNHLMFTFSVSSRRYTEKEDIDNSKRIVNSSGTIYLSVSGLDDTSMYITSFKRIQNAVENNSENLSISVSYDGPEFYKLSSEFGTTYGFHYQSMKKMVLSNDALTSWSKQIIQPNQPYFDPNHRTLIHPSWLDSFLQGAPVQVAQIPELNRPFVGLFVEKIICRTHVYQASPRVNTSDNESKSDETQSKFPTFYSETKFRINNPNLITGETRGFDENGTCVIHAVGVIMISVTTGFKDRQENECDVMLTQKSASTNSNNNNKTTTFTSKKPHVFNVSDHKYRTIIQNIIVRLISSSLNIESNSLNWDENLANMGVDSLLSIEIRTRLNKAFQDIVLSPSTLFDHPSINELINFIVSLKPTKINENNDDEEMETNNVFSSTMELNITSSSCIH